MTNKFLVSDRDSGERIDKFLAGRMPEISRSQVHKMIESDLVSINGRPVKKNYRLAGGDLLVAELLEEEEMPAPQPEDIALDILYEDDYILVVNKPAGMVVHPSQGHSDGTLVNALLSHCGRNLSSFQGDQRPGIVHRIDKDTSGLLVVAKEDRSHKKLENMIQEGSFERIYIGLARDNIKEAEGLIDKPIGRDPKNRMKRAVVEGGRRGLTHYKVIERFGQASLVELVLETGRTHQIRVHMAAIKHPLLGDLVYGPKGKSFGARRQMLHSMQVNFPHPHTGELMNFTAALPEDFEEVLGRLREIR